MQCAGRGAGLRDETGRLESEGEDIGETFREEEFSYSNT